MSSPLAQYMPLLCLNKVTRPFAQQMSLLGLTRPFFFLFKYLISLAQLQTIEEALERTANVNHFYLSAENVQRRFLFFCHLAVHSTPNRFNIVIGIDTIAFFKGNQFLLHGKGIKRAKIYFREFNQPGIHTYSHFTRQNFQRFQGLKIPRSMILKTA